MPTDADAANAAWLLQLILPGTLPEVPAKVDNISMDLVREYLARLNALEDEMQLLRDSLRDLRAEMMDKALPVKTITAALKMVRAKAKAVDGTPEMLAACVSIVMAMEPSLPKDEE